VELSEYDDIIKHLVAIAQKQDALNHQQGTTNRRLEETMHDIRSFVQQQGVVNTQNTTLIMRLSRTLDLIDEKLERLIPPPARRP
jgi:hypothetical protein